MTQSIDHCHRNQPLVSSFPHLSQYSARKGSWFLVACLQHQSPVLHVRLIIYISSTMTYKAPGARHCQGLCRDGTVSSQRAASTCVVWQTHSSWRGQDRQPVNRHCIISTTLTQPINTTTCFTFFTIILSNVRQCDCHTQEFHLSSCPRDKGAKYCDQRVC